MVKSLTIPLALDYDYFDELKTRLAEYSISHADFAREVGVSPVQVSRWFNKKPQNPQLETMKRCERAYDVLKRRAAQSK